MPHDATVDDVKKRVPLLGWEHMLKAVALYRDGSKLSPAAELNSDDIGDEDEAALPPRRPSRRRR